MRKQVRLVLGSCTSILIAASGQILMITDKPALTLKRQPAGLATRVHASDRCHLLGGAGSVKAVFACTCTTQLDGCGCPAATDGLDGF
jgi:hypothetical protein